MIDYSTYNPPIDTLVNISTAGKGRIVINDNPVQLRAVGRALAQAQLWKMTGVRVECHADEIIVTSKHETRHITWQERIVHEPIELWPGVTLPTHMIAHQRDLVYTIVVNDEDGERLSHRHSERQIARFWHDQHAIGVDEFHPKFVHPAFELPKDYIAAVMLDYLYRGSWKSEAVVVLIDEHEWPAKQDEVSETLTTFYRSELKLQFEGTEYETEAQCEKRMRRLEKR